MKETEEWGAERRVFSTLPAQHRGQDLLGAHSSPGCLGWGERLCRGMSDELTGKTPLKTS